MNNDSESASPVERVVRPAPPTRAVRLTLKMGADTLEELADALRHLADQAECAELTEGVSGGPSSGYIYELLQDPNMTHHIYHQKLREYLDGLREA